MPITPSVFQPIRANDVQCRPFKAYKNYKVISTNFSTASGYIIHDAIYKKHTPHVNDGTYSYPTNVYDNSNKFVTWNVIEHRYYRWNDPARCFDFKSIEDQKRFIWHSASILTCPYGQVGEQIKPGSFSLTSTIGSTTITLNDDGKGNLRDPLINTSSFATASNNFFYMTFNDMYKNYEDIDSISSHTGTVRYKLNTAIKEANSNNISIIDGVVTTGSYNIKSGLGVNIGSTVGANIRIPHDDIFNRFNKCDDWSISFWHRRSSTTDISSTILSKYSIGKESYLDKIDKKRKIRDVEYNMNDNISGSTPNISGSYPFHIISTDTSGTGVEYIFNSCNGTKMVSYTSGVVTKPRDWDHICVRNSSSLLEVFVNGATGTAATSGSLPIGVTSNNADITIGSTNSTRTDGGNNQHISEIRFYDYAINTIALNSLSNHNYLSGSLYQTNVAGNVFYKNGQIVVSSPMPKYNSGSGVFGNTFDGSYKGTHTIYENEVLIRVPKDVFNVSMNPSSTYQLSTTGDNCTTNQTEVLPGEFRKNLFVSGTLVPYITTIGLYNPKGQMLAAAKLAQPIQKNDDVDMNFIIRWDY